MIPASPQRSNYAAPNTPIASAKRARKTNTILSPSKGPSAGCISTPRQIAEEARKISADMHGASPSKNLFSPALRPTDMTDEQRARAEEEERKILAAQADAENDSDDTQIFNPYQFISCLPAHESVAIKGKICLPPASASNSKKITLALDLDETLVHCTVEPIPNPDIVFEVQFNDALYQVYVRKRPYLEFFLESVSHLFEIVIFTASQKVYADRLLNYIDPECRYISHRLFREACVFVEGNFLKDLTVLDRDLKRAVLVDNSPHAYGYQFDNGIPIESWFDDPEDTELLKLSSFLRRIVDCEDVRPIIHEHFKTYQLVRNAKLGYDVSLSAPPF